MAKKTETKASKKNGSSEHFEFSSEKKNKVLGVLLIFAGLLLFLGIVSYSERDNDKLTFSAEQMVLPFRAASDSTAGTIQLDSISRRDSGAGINNWLGIWGAYVAYIAVRKAVGYFSIFFALLFIFWGYSRFQEIDLRKKLYFTSFFVLMSLLASSWFGLFYAQPYVLSGNVGFFVGQYVRGLIGWFGAFLTILTLMIILLIVSFNLKIESLIFALRDFLKSAFGKKAADGDAEKAKKDKPVIENIKKDATEKTQPGEKAAKKEKNAVVLPAASDTAEPARVTEINIRKQEQKDSGDEPAESDGANILEEATPDPAVIEELKSPKRVSELETIREEEKKKPEPWEERLDYKLPSLDILNPEPPPSQSIADEELHHQAEQLKSKLALFDIQIDKIDVTPGPVVTLYELQPAPGVRINRIVSLTDDIALALKARGIRIIAPLPGRGTIGVEIPNQQASLVVARAVLREIAKSTDELPVALGKTISGDTYTTDLAKMPHLLVAGSTGSGKSVGINMIIASLLFSRKPDQVKLAIIDPKKIELSFYQNLRQHYLAICPDTDEDIVTSPMNAVILLKSVILEMEKRYTMLSKAASKNIIEYNAKFSDPVRKPRDTDEVKHHVLPYILVVIDELADLMMTAAKEVEEPITRLAQLARAVGIHLVLATQRPSVNVITGVIKANFSTRISYQVASKIDSRTILDMNGAEQLLGRGDMLYMFPGSQKPIRLQNAFISTEEVEQLTTIIKSQPGYSKPYYLPSIYEGKAVGSAGKNLDQYDPMFPDAAKLVVQHQQGSVTLLQRRLSLGYARAARVMDQLEEAGIVGPNDGSKARMVLVENLEQLETVLRCL